MAFTRKMLEAMGINAEQIESIMESHLEVVNGLKADRDKYKEQLDGIDTTKDWKTLYNKEHADFEAYKSEQGKRESGRAKEKAFSDALAAAGVAEKYRANIIRLSADTINALELDGEGKPVNLDALVGTIKTEWDGFIPTVSVQSHTPATPPVTAPTTVAKADVFARDEKGRFKLSTEERQAAIRQNLESTQKGF